MKAHKTVNRKPKAKAAPVVKLNGRLAAKKVELNKYTR
jgi:hypothetical protein